MEKPKGEASAEKARRLAEKQKIKAEKETSRAAYEKAKCEREQWSSVRKQLKASYRGAIPTRVSSNWSQSTSVTGVVNLTRFNQRALRDRARQLERDNAIADSILARTVENVIGSDGFKLQVQSSDAAWNQNAESLMRGWFPSADFYGLSWAEHQKLVFRSRQRDGDIGSLLLSNGQLQPVDGDYIATPPQKINANLYDGVEVDQFGRVAGYWIQTGDESSATYQRVAARDFIFLVRRKGNRQYRGEPCFAQSFTLFDQLSGYIDAVVVAQRIAACFGLIIKMKSASKRIAGLPYGTNADGNAQRQFTIEPGLIQTLAPDEEVEQLKPEQPGHGFQENLRALLRLLGLNLGLPLELVMLDFSQTNYSSARASLLQAQRAFESLQQDFIDNYLSRIYRWRISKFIKDGALQDRPDKFNHDWLAEPWPYLDPIKEVQAQQLLVDAGFSTQTDELLKKGVEIEQWRQKRSKEIAENKAADIPQVRSSYVAELTDPSADDVPAPSADNETNPKGDNVNEDRSKAAA